MALGRRRDEQQEMWVATSALPKSEGHAFYGKLNRLLAEANSVRTIEKICEPYYHNHLRRLLKEEQGIENPTDEELRRFDRQRKNKRVSNEEWMSSTDPRSRIAKMKDGRMHLVHGQPRDDKENDCAIESVPTSLIPSSDATHCPI